ncbi:MAG: DegT/DnrJ/EryC1/StrS family aminotransferase [Candidatus Omnitrophota bacterium]|nr:DegT/DnrJ/EryC1/StrS family aminotransferase [Candidatus Omnitrophota bacterium]
MKKRKKFLVFGQPKIGQAEISEVVRTLRSGWIGTGPKVAKFEEDFRRYKQAGYATAVSSGTAALHLSAMASGIGNGDEVITTALTFCATVNAIIHAQATPVLADVEPVTMNIDPGQIRKKITSKTKAILPVHLAGRPCRMDEILAIAKEYNLKIIEDCAHAIEANYKGKSTGTFGNFGCFSFYVTKNLVTAEGGMILTDKEDTANRIKILALHGMTKDAWGRFSDKGYKHYDVVERGFKYNMTDIQASLGIHQLKRLESNWRRRAKIWQKYNDAFFDLAVTVPAPVSPAMKHGYHLYTLLLEKEKCGICRDEFMQEMYERNIGTGVHYRSIPEYTYYQRAFGFKPEDYPVATRIGRQTVSLPLSAGLSDRDVEYVIWAVRDILK